MKVFAYEDGGLLPRADVLVRLPVPMYGAAAAIARGRLYVIGGQAAAAGTLVVSAKLTTFNVSADGFEATTPIPSPRSFGVAFVR